MCAKSLQLCLTLCDAVDLDCSLLRILGCVAMPSSRGSSRPSDQTHVSYVSCFGRQVLHH